MTDPNKTQIIVEDLNKTQAISSAPSINATQTIQPVQCPVCKSPNPPGVIYCVECGLVLSSALPDDVFGAPAVRPPCFVDDGGREHFLRPGANLIGREGDVLLADPRVSRKHAQATLQDGVITLVDLGSTNGTFVNGEQLQPNTPRQLTQGDKLSFGGVEVVMSFPGESQATQIAGGRKTQTLDAPPAIEKPVAFFVGEGNEFPLKSGTNSLGRRPNNDIVIGDPYVSGSHATIEVAEDGIYFTDVGSTNGTNLNGAPLPANQRTKINSDDQISIGQLNFKLKMAE
jgi:pSer/pThr/pTyr-binding forkhead associated (FHA) protein